MEPDDQAVPTGSVSQSSLRTIVEQQIQAGILAWPPCAPESIETIVDQVVGRAQVLLFQDPDNPANVDVPYMLNASSIMYLTLRFQELFGMKYAVVPYLHYTDKNHVVFQFKLNHLDR